MKKKVIAVAAIWSMLVSFTACSEKLDETLITQKNMDKLIEKAITDTEGREFLKEVRDSVPEHYEYSYENTDQTLTVNVDADVILPETDEIPMYQTEDGGFSQEQVTALYDYLFEGKETYTVLENGQKKPVDSSLQKTEYGLQLCCETDDGAQISIRAEYSDKGGYSYIDYQDTDMGNLSEQAMEENMDTFISVSLGITQEKARNIAEKLFQNIGIPIKRFSDMQGLCNRANIRDRNAGRFLHHFAKRTRQYHLAGARHGDGLNLEQIAAVLGIGHAVDYAHSSCRCDFFRSVKWLI